MAFRSTPFFFSQAMRTKKNTYQTPPQHTRAIVTGPLRLTARDQICQMDTSVNREKVPSSTPIGMLKATSILKGQILRIDVGKAVNDKDQQRHHQKNHHDVLDCGVYLGSKAGDHQKQDDGQYPQDPFVDREIGAEILGEHRGQGCQQQVWESVPTAMSPGLTYPLSGISWRATPWTLKKCRMP